VSHVLMVGIVILDGDIALIQRPPQGSDVTTGVTYSLHLLFQAIYSFYKFAQIVSNINLFMEWQKLHQTTIISHEDFNCKYKPITTIYNQSPNPHNKCVLNEQEHGNNG